MFKFSKTSNQNVLDHRTKVSYITSHGGDSDEESSDDESEEEEEEEEGEGEGEGGKKGGEEKDEKEQQEEKKGETSEGGGIPTGDGNELGDAEGSSKKSDTKEKKKKKEKKPAKALKTDANRKVHYTCLSTLKRTPQTYRLYEADIKKAGKLVHVKRNVWVAPIDYIEMILCDGKSLFSAKILYSKHNVSRVRPQRDDTWGEPHFLKTVQESIQYNHDVPGMTISFVFKARKKGTGFTMEIKAKNTRNLTTVYTKPITFREAEMTLSQFKLTVALINEEKLTRHVRCGHLTKAMAMVERGDVYIEREGSKDDKSGYVTAKEIDDGWIGGRNKWNLLHNAVAFGRRQIVEWLVEGEGMSVKTPTADGYTPLHLAVQYGHFEIAKYLVDKGVSNI